MKKQITLLTVLSLLIITQTFGQAPQGFKYQAITRNNSGNIIANTKVSFRMSILQGSTSGSVSYEETDTATTNQFGLANLSIGMGALVSGKMDTINWGKDNYFLKIEFDPTGGSNFTVMGTSQMLSVPYALYAQSAGSANGWGLIGNAGTVDETNFIGTTDNVALNFKVNNMKAGRIDQTQNGPTFFGFLAGNNNIGLSNTGLSYRALFSNTTGHDNTASGSNALFSNIIGVYNTAFGSNALAQDTASGNTAVGNACLNQNTSGGVNTGIGYLALYNNTIGYQNSASGSQALNKNTSGISNVANGNNALYSNTTGNYNNAFGAFADVASGNLTNATAIGYSAIVAASNSLVLGGTGVYVVNVGIGTSTPTSKLQVVGLPVYANNAAAITGGLTVGAFYRTGADPDPVCVVH